MKGRRAGAVKQEFELSECDGDAYFVGPRTRERRVYGFFKRGFDVGFALMAACWRRCRFAWWWRWW